MPAAGEAYFRAVQLVENKSMAGRDRCEVGVVMRYLGQFPSELQPRHVAAGSIVRSVRRRSDLKETIIPELLEEDPSLGLSLCCCLDHRALFTLVS